MRSAPLSALRWTGPAVLALVGLAAACNGGSATYAPSAATPEPSAATPEPSAATPEPSAATPEPSAATPEPSGDPLILARPYALRVPTGYRAGTPMPLVIVLHGYGTDGVVADELFGFGTILDERGFLLALPNGVPGRNGLRFWNATDACCDFGRTGVDDVAYLRAVIDDVGARYTIDPKRIFAVGHSNGGFMAHRLACDLSDRIAAIVSLAGAVWADPSSCRPTEPISVAQLHGTADFLIRFDGGKLAGVPYPGAVETVAMWAAKDGCGTTAEDAPQRLDLDARVAGAETTVRRYDGCPTGAAVQLWTLDGSGHRPTPSGDWTDTLYDFLEAHPKP